MTTRNEIYEWFKAAQRTQKPYLLVVCDTFDHTDYPIWADDAEDCLDMYAAHNGPNMQRVMEVYDISLGWEPQAHGRVMNLPKETR